VRRVVLGALAVVVAACGAATTTADTTAIVEVAALGGTAIAVLLDGEGPIAWRPSDDTGGWLPDGDAAWVAGTWWALIRRPGLDPGDTPLASFPYGDVITSSAADLDGDGSIETVVSYRHPAREVPWDPRPVPTDANGRSAHLGVITADGSPIWLAHRIPHPVGAIAGCGPVVALGYSTFDGEPTAATAATWIGFGFTLAPELPGAATVGCADVDLDGVLDPVVLRGES
jgi:hypothetical protein